jgi:hypothetical protein
MVFRPGQAAFEVAPLLIHSLQVGQDLYLRLTAPFNTIVGGFLFGSSVRPSAHRARALAGGDPFPCPSTPWALSDPDGRAAASFGLCVAVDRASEFVELGPLAGGWGY